MAKFFNLCFFTFFYLLKALTGLMYLIVTFSFQKVATGKPLNKLLKCLRVLKEKLALFKMKLII